MKPNNGNPQDPPSPQPVQDPVIVLCQFAHRVQLLVMEMDLELRETRFHSEELVKENKQLSQTIQSINEAIAARDATVEELKARIEKVTSEKAKLQAA